LSEYTFGDMSYSGGNPGDGQQSGVGQGQQEQSPKWFRDYMEKASAQNAALTAQLESLTAEKRQAEIAGVFEQKGFSRAAATLYDGAPDKVDEWLSTHGDALARTGQQQMPPQDTRPPGGMPPQQPLQQTQSVVPPNLQADLQKLQQQGIGSAAAPQGSSDDDLAAALRATTTPDEFFQVAQAHGWQYSRDNMGFA
jgi:hypothetical protein